MRNWITVFILLISLLMTAGLYALRGDDGQQLPEPVSLGSLTNIFHPVEFSHHTHLHMLKEGTGCETCHHEFEDGDFEPCSECHLNYPENLSDGTPSLNAAYHKKCMSCHKENSPDKSLCNTCHVVRDDPLVAIYSKNRMHARRLAGPETLRFDTPDADEPLVMFHHKEHLDLFRLECNTCHEDEKCVKCHSYSETPMSEIGTLETLHVPCESCHDTEDDDGCQFCHKSEPSSGFTHDLTGWPLKAYHRDQACAACHEGQGPVQALDRTCTNCHSNFTVGEFDHSLTGLELFEEHQEFDCYECHVNEQFDQPPVCTECHDDYSYPDDLPGEYLE